MDIEAIRAGIKANLEAIDKLAVHHVVPPTLMVPCVLVTTGTPFIEYHTANAKGLATLNFNLQVLVSKSDERRAQEALDAYVASGPGASRSIIDAIEADKTLGGACSNLIVTQAGEYFSVEDGEKSLGSTILNLTVYATRN